MDDHYDFTLDFPDLTWPDVPYCQVHGCHYTMERCPECDEATPSPTSPQSSKETT